MYPFLKQLNLPELVFPDNLIDYDYSVCEFNTADGTLTIIDLKKFEKGFKTIHIHWCDRPNASVDIFLLLKCGNTLFILGIQAKFEKDKNMTILQLYREAHKFCNLLGQIKKRAKECSLDVVPCFILVPEDLTTVNLNNCYKDIKAIEQEGIKQVKKKNLQKISP